MNRSTLAMHLHLANQEIQKIQNSKKLATIEDCTPYPKAIDQTEKVDLSATRLLQKIDILRKKSASPSLLIQKAIIKKCQEIRKEAQEIRNSRKSK